MGHPDRAKPPPGWSDQRGVELAITSLFLEAPQGPGLPEVFFGTHILQLTHAEPPGVWAAKSFVTRAPVQPHLPQLCTAPLVLFLQFFPGCFEVQ